MTTLSSLQQIHRLKSFGYRPSSYTKNKAALWNFLDKLQKNEETLSPNEIRCRLKQIQPIFTKLKSNQQQIYKRFGERDISVLQAAWLRITQLVHLFHCAYYGFHHFDDLKCIAKKIEEQAYADKIKSPAVLKFINLARKIEKTIAVGKLVKGAVSLDKDYWLETLGMRLVIDGKKYEGHLYTGYLITEQKYLEKWKREHDQTNTSYSDKYSFEDYMNFVVIPHMTPQEKETLKSKLSIVEYFTERELVALEAHFDQEGRVYTQNPTLNAWVDYKAQNPNSKLSYHQFALQSSKMSNKRQHQLKDQTYLYVLDHQGRLFLHIKERGKINHTSLSNGHAVLAAGSIKVVGGKIVGVDTFSGHYKPKEQQLLTFLKFLQKSHVDLSQTKLTYVGNYDVQPWNIHEVQPSDVLQWIADRD